MFDVPIRCNFLRTWACNRRDNRKTSNRSHVKELPVESMRSSWRYTNVGACTFDGPNALLWNGWKRCCSCSRHHKLLRNRQRSGSEIKLCSRPHLFDQLRRQQSQI